MLLENRTNGIYVNDGSGVLNNNTNVPTDIHTALIGVDSLDHTPRLRNIDISPYHNDTELSEMLEYYTSMFSSSSLLRP
jgi:hypothetical protein